MQKIQKMHNGTEIPSLGFGTYLIPKGQETADAVQAAIECGYTHIDCASVYKNEKGVAEGIKNSGVKRSDLFLVSKVWNNRQKYRDTFKAFNETLERLQTDYLDLYLIHWPKPDSGECWKALEKLYEDQKVRSIGVCNFTEGQMENLLKTAKVVPMVNQVELHPCFPQYSLQKYCKSRNILVESWGPLMQGKIFDIPLMKELAGKYSCTIAQLAAAWQLRQDNICLAKSVNPERIKANFNIPEIEISKADLERMDALESGRIGADPENFDF